jgi:hypothetical protein
MSEIFERVVKAIGDGMVDQATEADVRRLAYLAIEAMRPRGTDRVPSGAYPGMTPQQYFNALIDEALR